MRVGLFFNRSFAVAAACLFEDSALFVRSGPFHRFLRPADAELVSGGPFPLPVTCSPKVGHNTRSCYD